MIVKQSKKKMERVIELRQEALKLGQVCSPLERLNICLGTALARRLQQRVGNFIYQSIAFSSDNFPKAAADQILPPWLVTCDNSVVKTWKATTVAGVTAIFAPLLSQQSAYVCAGSSRALRTASEKVIRVVATPMPEVEVSWVEVSGMDRLYVNCQYVLWDEAGELHAPKDPDRAEIQIDPELETALRQQVLADLLLMYDKKLPLSPGFLRQLGHMEEAAVLEAILLNRPRKAEPPPEREEQLEAPLQRPTRSTHFEVERIISSKESSGRAKRWYLVLWAGYHLSWEPWRISGEVGDPIETWEPEAAVINTNAMVTWRAKVEEARRK